MPLLTIQLLKLQTLRRIVVPPLHYLRPCDLNPIDRKPHRSKPTAVQGFGTLGIPDLRKKTYIGLKAIRFLQSNTMTAGSAVEGLQPVPLWQFFEKLTQIPRPSKKEHKVLQWLKEFATSHGLEYKQDAIGNLVIKRPGSGGGENAPTVVVQGHVDMVTEKNSDVVHNFEEDGLKLLQEDGWLTADGTTLGADNGIGVCAALSLLSMPPSAKLPPLEGLFTVDEEMGLCGAFELDPTLITGRTLLNLDTEEWGEIFIGCAGGGDSETRLPVSYAAVPEGYTSLQVGVTGLMGGHSGVNIQEDRGNAVAICARILDAVVRAVPATRIVTVKGGDKRNAIARECFATLVAPAAVAEDVKLVVAGQAADLKEEYGMLEKELSIQVAGVAPAKDALMSEAQDMLISLLRTHPHGVVKWSHAVPGLVETSCNLASVAPGEPGPSGSPTEFIIGASSRSSLKAALEAQRDRISKIAALCGATCKTDSPYPGWAPNPSSPVLELTKSVFKEVLGREPKVGAIHAGLECGVIGEKLPGIDMVSYGPTIRGAHSPDEKVEIETVAQFWDVTLKLMNKLADVRA